MCSHSFVYLLIDNAELPKGIKLAATLNLTIASSSQRGLLVFLEYALTSWIANLWDRQPGNRMIMTTMLSQPCTKRLVFKIQDNTCCLLFKMFCIGSLLLVHLIGVSYQWSHDDLLGITSPSALSLSAMISLLFIR